MINNYRLSNDVVSVNSYVVKCTFGLSFYGVNQFDFNSAITKSFYNIPQHQWLRIQFHYIALDGWEGDQLLMAIDNLNNYDEKAVYSSNVIMNVTYDNTLQYADYCKLSTPDSLGRAKVSISHSSSMVKLRIYTSYMNSTSFSNPNTAYMFWALRDLQIVVGQCPDTCLTCSCSSVCLTCIDNYILNPNTSQC